MTLNGCIASNPTPAPALPVGGVAIRSHSAATCIDLSLLSQLTALGPLLCLYPPAPRRLTTPLQEDLPWPAQPELQGLLGAQQLRLDVRVESWGVSEWLWFAADRVRFGIALLPDSDYYAWDVLLDRLATEGTQVERRASDLHRVGYEWCASIKRFEAMALDGSELLALRRVPRISGLGRALAQQVATRRGARLDAELFGAASGGAR